MLAAVCLGAGPEGRGAGEEPPKADTGHHPGHPGPVCAEPVTPPRAEVALRGPRSPRHRAEPGSPQGRPGAEVPRRRYLPPLRPRRGSSRRSRARSCNKWKPLKLLPPLSLSDGSRRLSPTGPAATALPQWGVRGVSRVTCAAAAMSRRGGPR